MWTLNKYNQSIWKCNRLKFIALEPNLKVLHARFLFIFYLDIMKDIMIYKKWSFLLICIFELMTKGNHTDGVKLPDTSLLHHYCLQNWCFCSSILLNNRLRILCLEASIITCNISHTKVEIINLTTSVGWLFKKWWWKWNTYENDAMYKAWKCSSPNMSRKQLRFNLHLG